MTASPSGRTRVGLRTLLVGPPGSSIAWLRRSIGAVTEVVRVVDPEPARAGPRTATVGVPRNPLALAGEWVRAGALRTLAPPRDDVASLGVDDHPMVRIGIRAAEAEGRLLDAVRGSGGLLLRAEDVASDPVVALEHVSRHLGTTVSPDAAPPALTDRWDLTPRMREGSVARGRVLAGYLAAGGRLYAEIA